MILLFLPYNLPYCEYWKLYPYIYAQYNLHFRRHDFAFLERKAILIIPGMNYQIPDKNMFCYNLKP